MAESYWTSLDKLEVIESPKSIMSEQASLLQKMTNGILVGAVEDFSYTSRTAPFGVGFVIVVPTRNNYEYRLMTVKHPLSLYPADVSFEGDDYVVSDPETFRALLKEILSSKKVQYILKQLLSLAK